VGFVCGILRFSSILEHSFYLLASLANFGTKEKGSKPALLTPDFPFSALFKLVFDILAENGGNYAQKRS
jgi:hypothetical protein